MTGGGLILAGVILFVVNLMAGLIGFAELFRAKDGMVPQVDINRALFEGRVPAFIAWLSSWCIIILYFWGVISAWSAIPEHYLVKCVTRDSVDYLPIRNRDEWINLNKEKCRDYEDGVTFKVTEYGFSGGIDWSRSLNYDVYKEEEIPLWIPNTEKDKK